MLLVITPSAKARGCAQAIQQVTSEETHVAATSSQALARFAPRNTWPFSSIRHFWKPNRSRATWCWNSIGTAVPVHVNFAINNMDRVARELRAALLRHKKASPAGPARGTARAAKRTQRAPSRPCCFLVKWRCKSLICRAEPKAGCAPSTNWPRRYASSSKAPSEAQRRRSLTAPALRARSARFCAPARFPTKILPGHRSFPHYNNAAERNAESAFSRPLSALSQGNSCTFWLQPTP